MTERRDAMKRAVDDRGVPRASLVPEAAHRSMDSLRQQVEDELDDLPEEAPHLQEAFQRLQRYRREEQGPQPHTMTREQAQQIVDFLEEIEAKLANLDARLISVLQQVTKLNKR